MREYTIESCVESLEEAIYAASAGATQLEVCSRLDVDGLTPEFPVLNAILSTVNIPCKVMISNREGNYFYSPDDLKVMMASIQQIKAYKISGIVFGANRTDENGKITLDIGAIYQICKAAYPLPVTIHKAIDKCDDISQEIKALKGISNVQYILSSGGKLTAKEGAKMLSKMKEETGSQIHIIAAGKILPNDLEWLKEKTQLTHFHGRRIV